MNLRNTFSGVILIAFAACLGVALVYLPNWIITNYERAQTLGAFAGTLYLAVVGLGGCLLVGSAGWTVWKLWGNSIFKKRRRVRRNRNPSELSIGQREFEIDENVEQVQQLAADAANDSQLADQLNPLLKELEQKRIAQTLEIVAFGTISSGKSSVLNLLAGRNVFATDASGGTTVTRNEIPWPGIDKVTLVDTPGLGEIDGALHVNIAAESAKDADLVLVVVDGPLRQSEHDLLARLGKMEKRVIVCLNKSDWYAKSDREKLTQQIFNQTEDFVLKQNIVCIQAQPGHRLRRTVLADGSESDETLTIDPDIDPLARRMIQIVNRDGKDLLVANLLLQSRGLVEKARLRVKESLDRKAWKIVDKYMWGSAGIAAVNPIPVVDLLAGSAISTKMIMELADVYQQKVDLETASKWLSEMGKNLIGMLGAHGATVAISAIVASSLIKVVPVAGTFAGGALQGVVQAVITRWIGAVFIEYFRNEMQTPEGGLSGLARRQWDIVTTAAELGKLVQNARKKIPSSDP